MKSIHIHFDCHLLRQQQALRVLLIWIVRGKLMFTIANRSLISIVRLQLGANISPKKVLYKQRWEEKDGRKILSMVRFPTPLGWKSIDEKQYKEFWYGVNMNNIFHTDRVKHKTTSEKEEMCFVYLIVIELRERDYLDQHNKPNASIIYDTKRNCSLDEDWTSSTNTISIKNTVFQSYR